MKEKSGFSAGSVERSALSSQETATGLDPRSRESTDLDKICFTEVKSSESGVGGREEIEGEAVQIEPVGPSETAQRVRRLQQAVLDAAARRKRLPQPLFWSLFHTELEEIRRTKERKRILTKLLS